MAGFHCQADHFLSSQLIGIARSDRYLMTSTIPHIYITNTTIHRRHVTNISVQTKVTQYTKCVRLTAQYRTSHRLTQTEHARRSARDWQHHVSSTRVSLTRALRERTPRPMQLGRLQIPMLHRVSRKRHTGGYRQHSTVFGK